MNTIKEKAPTAAAIREISVSRVSFQPPPKKAKLQYTFNGMRRWTWTPMNANIASMERWDRQSKTTNFCSILDSRCSSCLEIPILWQEVVQDQDLIDSDELQQLHQHHQVWGCMLDQGKTIKAVMRVGITRNMPLRGKWQRRTVTMRLFGGSYNVYNFFVLHFYMRTNKRGKSG